MAVNHCCTPKQAFEKKTWVHFSRNNLIAYQSVCDREELVKTRFNLYILCSVTLLLTHSLTHSKKPTLRLVIPPSVKPQDDLIFHERWTFDILTLPSLAALQSARLNNSGTLVHRLDQTYLTLG